mgnify:CR=1 FL=1
MLSKTDKNISFLFTPPTPNIVIYIIIINEEIIVVNEISLIFGQNDFLSMSKKFSPLGSESIAPNLIILI